jgi:hypothetical protein
MDKPFTADEIREALANPAAPLLRRMLETYTERRASYGPSEQRFADVMLAFFPDGLTIERREDWVRFGLFVQIASKLSRYSRDFHEPHVDSIHDMGPYTAMLEAEDRRVLGMEPFYRPPESD